MSSLVIWRKGVNNFSGGGAGRTRERLNCGGNVGANEGKA
jgi:hypothetical protein